MANGTHRVPASLEVLDQRQYTLERSLQQLGEDTNRQIRDLASSTSSQISGVSVQVRSLENALTERSKIPWPALGVMLSFLTIVGGLVWYPVKNEQDRLQAALVKVIEGTPTTREIDTSGKRRDDWQRYAEERFKKVEEAENEGRKLIVPRGEHEEKWRGADIRFADQQRQIDHVRNNFADLYSPKDALKSMQARIDDLERQIRQRAAP